MPIIVKPITSNDQLTRQEMQITGDFMTKDQVSQEEQNNTGGEVLACLEIINKLGVVGRSARNKANMDPLDGEMLELFEKHLSHSRIGP